MSCGGHPLVRTPAPTTRGQGVRIARHYRRPRPVRPAEPPCTRYFSEHRSSQRDPLDTRFDTSPTHAPRRLRPSVFGYRSGVDPRLVDDPHDPRLSTYEGVLPGFDPVLDMSGWQLLWLHWLNGRGYDFADPIAALEVEHERPAELSTSTFLTDGFLGWLGSQAGPWFAHLSYLRPIAKRRREYSTSSPESARRHCRDHNSLVWYRLLHSAAYARGPDEVARIQAQYFGPITRSTPWPIGRVAGTGGGTNRIASRPHGEQRATRACCRRPLLDRATRCWDRPRPTLRPRRVLYEFTRTSTSCRPV